MKQIKQIFIFILILIVFSSFISADNYLAITDSTATKEYTPTSNFNVYNPTYVQSHSGQAYYSYFEINYGSGMDISESLFTLYSTAITSNIAVSFDWYYCNDVFDETTLTWNNQNTEVTNCAGTPFYSSSSTTYSTGYNTINITNITNNDVDGIFTIKILPNPNNFGGVLLTYNADEEAVVKYRPHVNYTNATIGDALTVDLDYPINGTHYNLENPLPSKVFNGSIVTSTNNDANCTINNNGTTQYWNDNFENVKIQEFSNNTGLIETNYSITVNCSDGLTSKNISFWFIVDSTNVTALINIANNSIQANDFNLEVVYFDLYLYKTNTTIIRMSDNTTIYNSTSGVLPYATKYFNVTYPITVLNSSYVVGEYIKVIMNGVDTHTASKFKERPTKTKITVFDKNVKEYNLKYGKVKLEYPLDLEIEEDYSLDRMHFKIKDTKFKEKKDKKDKKDKTIPEELYQYIEADKIDYYEDSPYPCHMIINDKYWYDCVGMKEPKVTKERNNRYKINFDMGGQEEIITKSLGGLNEVYKEVIFKINKNFTGDIVEGDFFDPPNKVFNYTARYNFTTSSFLVSDDCITITGSNVSSYDGAYCYSVSQLDLEDVVLFEGSTPVDVYINITNSTGDIITVNFDWFDESNNNLRSGFNFCDSNSYCTLDELTGLDTEGIDSVYCQASLKGSWFNFSKDSAVLETSKIALCNASINYSIVNFTYFDESTNTPINATASFDLSFYEGTSTFSIQSNNSGEYTAFCTDVNPTTAVFNLKLYDTIILSSPSYITRVFNIPFSQGLDVSNDPSYNYSYYLIKVANSTTITYNWQNTEYASLNGIMQIYRCNDDGSKTLIESTNVANGKATANLQLFTTAYSYSFTSDGVTYTEPSYYDCHVESTELQRYTVDITQIDVLPVVGLYLMDCHIYNVSSSIVTMEWDGNDEDATNIEACIIGYREDIYGRVQVYESCVNQTSGSLTRNVALTGFNYYVQGTLEQNGVLGFCQETVVFNQRSDTSETFGINGIFLAVILILALSLLAAGDDDLVIIFSIVAILIIWIIGIVSFNWVTISSIIAIGIILAIIYRYTIKK